MINKRLQSELHFGQWVVISFIIVLSTLMLHDASTRDDVLSASYAKLKQLKSANLDDPEIAQTARDLDYLYRATYFQTQDRQSYGFMLLGIAFLTLCMLLVFERYLFSPELKVPQTNDRSSEHERKERLIYSVCGVALLVLILLIVKFTIFNTSHTTHQVAKAPPTALVSKQQTPAIPINRNIALQEASKHWPQFRGSILPNQNSLPVNWNFKTKWQTNIPLPGFNSPVVWGDRIFLAGGNESKRSIYCFDTKDGVLVWQASCSTAPVYPDLTEDTGVSAPTLCVDNARVYGIFATGEMICCDHAGNILWQRQLPTPDIMYGYASSPLLLGDRLIIQYDIESSQTLYAIDVLTGKDIWKSQRQTSASWSTPIAKISEEHTIIFTAGNLAAEGIDAATGKILWKNEELGGEVATSAIVHHNDFFFSNTGAMTAKFTADKGEIKFKNDYVPAPDVASPVYINNSFLLFTSGGSVIGIDTTTGKESFEHNFDNGFYASPVVVADKIIAVNLDGELFQLNTSEHSLVVEGQYSIGKKVVSIPALHRGNIIVRTADNQLIYLESVP